MNPVQLMPGPFRKIISVFVKGQDAPAATLEMVGTMQPSATFSPSVIDFGRVAGGTARPVSLSVTLDDKLTKNGKPRLVSTDPDVLIATSPPFATNGKQFSYRVALSPRTPLGPLQARLYLMPSPGNAETGAARRASLSVPVFAEVVGRVSAEPSAVAFGTVTAGMAATQRVELTAASPEALQGVQVLSAYANLTTTVSTAADSAARPRLLITLTLGPNTPVTSLKTQVLVTTAAGERLVIPVFAVIAPR